MIHPMALGDVTAYDQTAFDHWLSAHAEWHQQIYRAVLQGGYPSYSRYPLDRADWDNLEQWAGDHDREHRGIAGSTGVVYNYDLSRLDRNKPRQWSLWMGDHARVHLAIQRALNIF